MSADEHGAGRVSQGHGDELRCRSGPGAGACAGTGAGIPHADKDPVCGMDVDPHTTAHRATLDGRSYYFCSGGCRVRFLASPATYLDRNGGAAEPVPEGTIYTCPMHPEVRQVAPGTCPICGMALEPMEVKAEAGPNPELIDMTRRLRAALVPTALVATLQMGGHLTNVHMLLGQRLTNWVELLLATPVVLWAGPFFVRGRASVKTLRLNMFTLIAMGTGVAWIYSIAGTALPGLFPAALRGSDGSVAVYFEAAAVIILLVLLGQVLELKAREQTSGAIKALLNLAPKRARRRRADGSEEDVALEAVVVGDLLRVRPGEAVPVDGEILEGRSTLDESMITGESMPATKEAGAGVIGGTMNQSGSFLMRAQKIGRDTMLAQIVRMVAQAQRSRAPIQRLADQVSAWFVPLVIAVAVIAFFAWVLWGPEPRLAYGLIAAVSVLIIALSMRLRSCDANVHHGGCRARCAGGGPDQKRRGARAHGADRHAHHRQDLDVDRRQAARDRGAPRAGFCARRSAQVCREPRAQQPAPARGGRGASGAGAQDRSCRRPRLRCTDRQRCDRFA